MPAAPPHSFVFRSVVVLLAIACPGGWAATARAEPVGLDFYEKRIRPLLIERCYECHGARSATPAGGLRLDHAPDLTRERPTGPAIVPGHPEAGQFLRVVRQTADTSTPEHRLTAAQAADLTTWLTVGAPMPTNPLSVSQPKPEATSHWSFRPVQDQPVPSVRDPGWPKNDLDRFVLAKLEVHGLRPNVKAERRALIRRATFDLLGLPPTPAEVEAFVNDATPDAFTNVVNRLLASPHYGERWGRHWLDVVRYADTAGDPSDFPIPQAHLYRDYVVASFNRDMPYDRFLREQLAGDLLPARTQARRNEKIIATGFIAQARRFEGSASNAFHLVIEDTLDTMSRAVLGLSFSCARCHDHKHDPVTMHDYYALYGIFSSTRYPFPGSEPAPRQKDFVPLLAAGAVEARMKPYRKKLAAFEATVAGLVKEMARLELEGFNTRALARNLERATKQRDKLKAHPPQIPTAYAVAEGAPHAARLQPRGEPSTPGEEVPRGFVRSLGGGPLSEKCRDSGRLELAQWLTAPAHPLTARVMVNRIWQHHFGRGLVATPDDFGTRGGAPSHPELLDWLASRFVESGWSVKTMHRLLMLSATYQQSSGAPGDLDPDNVWLSRFPRQRLEAEQIRDALLAVSGALDLEPGGPHPFPPEQTWAFTQHDQFTAIYETDKRSVYLMQQRIKRHPFFAVFDGADPNTSVSMRHVSTTPMQALFAMNDPFVHTQATRLAERLLRERADDRQRLDLAHQLAFARSARPEEVHEGLGYLERVRQKLAANQVPSFQYPLLAWSSYARALLASNEFMFVD